MAKYVVVQRFADYKIGDVLYDHNGVEDLVLNRIVPVGDDRPAAEPPAPVQTFTIQEDLTHAAN